MRQIYEILSSEHACFAHKVELKWGLACSNINAISSSLKERKRTAMLAFVARNDERRRFLRYLKAAPMLQ
jgi:hypothetical protein